MRRPFNHVCQLQPVILLPKNILILETLVMPNLPPPTGSLSYLADLSGEDQL